MENVGVDMSGYYQKLLTNIPESVDTLITMSFNVIVLLCHVNTQKTWY